MPKKPPPPTTKPKTKQSFPPNPIASSTTPKSIPWPPLPPSPKNPYYYPSKPTLQLLIPNQAYIIPDFFAAPLCKTYTSFLAALPLVTTPNKPKKGDAVRVNDRFQVQDDGFAAQLWEYTSLQRCVTGRTNPVEERLYSYDDDDDDEDGEVTRHIDREDDDPSKNGMWGGEPLGLNGNIRIYRYTKGQFFDKHYDDSNTLTFNTPGQPARPARTTWTLLIYLTACEGGETIFYPEPTRKDRNPQPVAVKPVPGMALLHRHGEHCMLHEGAEVRSGEKWVLRSDLVVAR
ncbi:hypothetical protein BO86DRAFT_405487 [Aspergillus japonicus CBS 114.51]|uniref:Fe2OG dioxygenase domain-containing protein n=1 Tax=Aspergillus japonicus CBS 114.51 TaxID=1448312 RepID=A0A8T8XHG1_ASPJA|nr:hypothetical protein BO86DRAFT_405487 [Aspergillus japonicus CBS 114.51]RAH87470.1 hypothetical protein BO86DRAFT_405487 [Aspergillus japonicus CBS 114.51]